ncbi:hypothetical protein BURCENBC7_AP1416 [Burkholderia cenocepacia BC7]|nr:hypothetical protein BURCENK562V_C7475 [Burkholderia cenocepacia K56-2Valvano]ERI27127.1 hypothetical protein BURCENBC7_AP1416 [Burkholderia cenocepacia BC7]
MAIRVHAASRAPRMAGVSGKRKNESVRYRILKSVLVGNFL